MVSVTTWRRIEPRPTSEALTGMEARLADPLWLLGREWQLGGFIGEDAGWPVDATVTYEVAPLSHWRRTGPEHPGEVRRSYPRRTPVEALVQQLPRTSSTPKERALGGQRFLRFLGPTLAGQYRDQLRRTFPLTRPHDVSTSGDVAGAGWDALLGPRSIDGADLRDALVSTGPDGEPFIGIPALTPPVQNDHRPAVLAAARKYVAWWNKQFPADVGAWSTRGLSMPFELTATLTTPGDGAPRTVAFTAQDYRGDRVDWHTFTAHVDKPPVDPSEPDVRDESGHLARIQYPGMPSARWWQFEDSAVNLSWLNLPPTDLGMALLVEIALLDGGDYWDVGLQIEAGSVVAIRSVTVKDSFGDNYPIPSTIEYDTTHDESRRWRMYHADIAGIDEPLVALMVPDVIADYSESTAREEVHFGPDENANLVWAMENLVTGPWGNPLLRLEAQRAQQADPPPPDSEPARYRLSSSIADHWYPMTSDSDRTLRLEEPAAVQSTLLTSSKPFVLSALTVPRTGRRVTARRRRTRGSNGVTYSWLSWRVEPRREELDSNLRHDYLANAPE